MAETFDKALREAFAEQDAQVHAGTYKPPAWPDLTLDDIREIRRADKAGEQSWRGNAERFGIHSNHVDHIVNSSSAQDALLGYEVATGKRPAPHPGTFLKMIGGKP